MLSYFIRPSVVLIDFNCAGGDHQHLQNGNLPLSDAGVNYRPVLLFFRCFAFSPVMLAAACQPRFDRFESASLSGVSARNGGRQRRRVGKCCAAWLIPL